MPTNKYQNKSFSLIFLLLMVYTFIYLQVTSPDYNQPSTSEPMLNIEIIPSDPLAPELQDTAFKNELIRSIRKQDVNFTKCQVPCYDFEVIEVIIKDTISILSYFDYAFPLVVHNRSYGFGIPGLLMETDFEGESGQVWMHTIHELALDSLGYDKDTFHIFLNPPEEIKEKSKQHQQFKV